MTSSTKTPWVGIAAAKVTGGQLSLRKPDPTPDRCRRGDPYGFLTAPGLIQTDPLQGAPPAE